MVTAIHQIKSECGPLHMQFNFVNKYNWVFDLIIHMHLENYIFGDTQITDPRQIIEAQLFRAQ